MNYLAICAVVKDEDYLQEWVEYHRIVGVDHFYLYANDGDPVQSSLRKQIEDGAVTTIFFPGHGKEVLLGAYSHCLKHFGSQSRWIAFIDADEFLVPIKCDDVRILLKNYESFGGLAVSWLVFGSSYHILKPRELQIESYVYRSKNDFKPHNMLIKSIVQTAHTLSPQADNTHAFTYNPGYYCVNEKYEQVFGIFSRNTTEIIQLNHYRLRSYADYLDKMRRWSVNGQQLPDEKDRYRTHQWFFEIDSVSNEVYDDHILRFLPMVKTRLNQFALTSQG